MAPSSGRRETLLSRPWHRIHTARFVVGLAQADVNKANSAATHDNITNTQAAQCASHWMCESCLKSAAVKIFQRNTMYSMMMMIHLKAIGRADRGRRGMLSVLLSHRGGSISSARNTHSLTQHPKDGRSACKQLPSRARARARAM